MKLNYEKLDKLPETYDELCALCPIRIIKTYDSMKLYDDWWAYLDKRRDTLNEEQRDYLALLTFVIDKYLDDSGLSSAVEESLDELEVIRGCFR